MYKECRHIKVSGGKCRAAALKDQPFCYFHSRQRRRVTRTGFEKFTLDLPPLEDRSAIQVALSEIAAALADGRIEFKRAGLLLYTLQIASQNAKNPSDIVSHNSVREMTVSEDGQELAPVKNSRSDEVTRIMSDAMASVIVNRLDFPRERDENSEDDREDDDLEDEEELDEDEPDEGEGGEEDLSEAAREQHEGKLDRHGINAA